MDDELRLEDHLLELVGLAVSGFLDEHPCGGAAELLAGLADGGEGTAAAAAKSMSS